MSDLEQTLNQIPDHFERAIDRLPGYMGAGEYDTTNARYLAPTLGEVQRAEDLVYSLVVDRSLVTAQGAALDQYGRLLDEPRAGLSDGDYRRVLGARIIANRSAGTYDELAALITQITEADSVRAVPYGSMTAVMIYLVRSPVDARLKAILLRLIDLAIPLGTTVYVIEAWTAEAFAFADDPDSLPGYDVGLYAELLIA